MQYSVLNRLNPPQPSLKFDFNDAVHSVILNDARAGEYYSFGLAIFSETGGEVRLTFPELKSDNATIPSSAFFCINAGGTDDTGRRFEKKITAFPGCDLLIWMCIRIPENISGHFAGSLDFTCGDETASLPFDMTVSGTVLNHGFDEPEKLTRLAWLDSTLCQEGPLPAPYTAPAADGRTVHILGRDITVGESGLPSSFVSFFDKNVQIDNTPRTVSDGAELSFVLSDGSVIPPSVISAGKGEQYPEGVRYVSESVYGDILKSEISTSIEFDGYVICRIKVTALKDCSFNDAVFEYSLRDGFDFLAMGLGLEGCTTPSDYEYHWDSEKHQNILWTGGINGGLRCKWMGDDFVEPVVGGYYRHRKLHMSKSFANPDENGDTRGTIVIKRENGTVITAHSGAFELKAGENRIYDTDFLMSPFKPLDMHSRMTTRYYHRGVADIEEAKKSCATHINLHHATEINPYINYPFRTDKELKAYVSEAHKEGIAVKVYDTIREQSDKTCEMNALLTLDTELFPNAVGGQGSVLWNEETLVRFRARFGDKKIPAWPTEYDMALVTDGHSRMCNYYIEGLRYLCEEIGIDGIYIDDSALSRRDLLRARRVFEQYNPPAAPLSPRKIDMHCGSYYGPTSGMSNTLNIHMPLMPYFDSIWIGEGFDHVKSSVAYWLTEISGTPFGIPGELLAGGLNCAKYRGMLFGATLRAYGNPSTTNPVGLWKFIISEKLEDTLMIGFWNDESPLRTGSDDVLGTVYLGSDKSVIALTNWSDKEVTITPTLNGKAITEAEVPAIEAYQEEMPEWNGTVTLEPKKGILAVVHN